MKLRLLVRPGWTHMKDRGVFKPEIFALLPNEPIPNGYEEIELLGVAEGKNKGDGRCSHCHLYYTHEPNCPNPRMTATEVVQSTCSHITGLYESVLVRGKNNNLHTTPFTHCPDCGAKL